VPINPFLPVIPISLSVQNCRGESPLASRAMEICVSPSFYTCLFFFFIPSFDHLATLRGFSGGVSVRTWDSAKTEGPPPFSSHQWPPSFFCRLSKAWVSYSSPCKMPFENLESWILFSSPRLEGFRVYVRFIAIAGRLVALAFSLILLFWQP